MNVPFPHPAAPLSGAWHRGVAAIALSLVAALPASARQIDWLQYFGSARHTGVNQQETTIHPANVTTLHVVTHVTLPSIVDGAPVYLSGVSTASGLIDILFLTTKDGRIVAVNANTLGPLWSKQAATTPNYTTSSPAVDPNRLYVYSYGLDGKVHKYQVADGTEIVTGGWPEVATLKPSVEKSSTAITIATASDGTNYLYIGNGGYPGDAGDYQGHITTINLATGAQSVFNANCSDQTVHFVASPGTPDCSAHVRSAVWARPGVIFDADNQKIYFGTGNGDFTANANGHEYGDSVVALHVDGTGSGGFPIDSYTPTEFQSLEQGDTDLGSTAPALLPPVPGSGIPHLGIQSGKDAKLRLLNLDNLSGSGGPNHVAGELQIFGVPQGNQVLTQLVPWANPANQQVWAFVSNDGGLAGVQVTASGGAPTISAGWHNSTGGTSPVIANGMLFQFQGGKVAAFDPTTGSPLWSETSPGGRHWESPIVVQGKLYVTDENAVLWLYAPDPAPPLGFFPVTPCRVLDTRKGGSLANGVPITVAVAGQCGIPADALAVSANLTIVSPSAAGSLVAAPAGVVPGTSNVSFMAGATRANNAIVSLTGNPVGSASFTSQGAATNLILDVNGYFK